MKKWIALVLCFATLLASVALLSGCGSKEKTPDTIKEAGELVIATSPDFPPFESLDGNGNVVGIEIDILNIVCEKLGVTLKISQMDFDSVLPGVQADKYDLGASGITVNEKRKKNVLFTDAYCLAAQAIVVNEGSSIQSKADLAGKSVAVQTGTTAESYCMENGYDVKSFTANNDAQSALQSGKVDAWVIDDLTAADMVKVNNAGDGTKLVILDEVMTTEPYAFALSFGSEELVAEINSILADLQSQGKIKEIFEKYDAPFTAPDQK